MANRYQVEFYETKSTEGLICFTEDVNILEDNTKYIVVEITAPRKNIKMMKLTRPNLFDGKETPLVIGEKLNKKPIPGEQINMVHFRVCRKYL